MGWIHGSSERSEHVEDKSPPLRGGGRRRRPRGVSKKKKKKIVRDDARKRDSSLPWYRCKRCNEFVLSYKKCRAAHYKKCPPYEDDQKVFDSVMDSLPFRPVHDHTKNIHSDSH